PPGATAASATPARPTSTPASSTKATASPCRPEASPSSGDRAPVRSAAATLTELDDGRTIEAKVGDTIELVLSENASTGYRWAFDGVDEQVVRAGEGE